MTQILKSQIINILRIPEDYQTEKQCLLKAITTQLEKDYSLVIELNALRTIEGYDKEEIRRKEAHLTQYASNIPGLNSSIDNETKMIHKLAFMIYPVEESDQEDETKFKAKKTWTYIRYHRLISTIRKYLNLMKEEARLEALKHKEAFKYGPRRNFCLLKKKGPSKAITNPTPMPVDVAKLEDLKPFLDTLAKNKKAEPNTSVGKEDSVQVFNLGAYYTDGRVDMCKQVVGPSWIQSLMDSIKNNPYVTHFLLGNNIVNLEGAEAISKFISDPDTVPKIKTWYIAGNRIDFRGLDLIAKSLETDTNVDSLWLKRNPLGIEGGKILNRLLLRNTSIRILDLHNTGLFDQGVDDLMHGLEQNTTLRSLYLDANGLTVASGLILANYFQKLTTLDQHGIDRLYVSINRLDDQGIQELVKALGKYRFIKCLSISSNRFGPETAKIIYESFKSHPTLAYLDLGVYKSTYDMGELPNNIGDQGVEWICKLVRENSTIQVLNIIGNNISAERIDQYCQTVIDQPSKTLLWTHYEQFGRSGIRSDLEVKMNQVLRDRVANLKMDMDYFNNIYVRNLRHTPSIRYIDSIYRNAM